MQFIIAKQLCIAQIQLFFSSRFHPCIMQLINYLPGPDPSDASLKPILQLLKLLYN